MRRSAQAFGTQVIECERSSASPREPSYCAQRARPWRTNWGPIFAASSRYVCGGAFRKHSSRK